MSENIVDQDLERAERDASPGRFPERKADNGAQRAHSPASFSTTSSDSRSIIREEMGASGLHPIDTQNMSMSRVNTRDLEKHPTALSRIETHRTQHSGTVGKSIKSRESRKPLPNFGAGKPYPPPLPEQEEYVVEFDGPDDPLHPVNWKMSKKLLISSCLAFTSLVSTFGSSIFSAATKTVAQVYGVGDEVGVLGVSLYVLGFATGPLMWAPLSELRGRKLPIIVAMFGFSIFSIATAVAKDLQTVLITRFFGGVFSSCPLAVVAAVFSDIYDNRTRGLAVTVFAMTVFTGPLLAPFIGGFIIINPNMGWRWTEYITALMGFLALGLDVIFMEETYAPIVLVNKASELRRRTQNWGIHAKQEEIEVDLRELITKNFTRPIRILISEPIVLLLTIYMSFIYGLLYLFLTAYPIVFQGIHGMNPGVGGLPYFGMVTGELLAGAYIVFTQGAYQKKLKANNNVPIPEWRLPPVMIGGVSFAIGLFWFGWTGYTDNIHWIVPTLSGLFSGFGLLAIFLQSLNYIIDAYLMFAASAVAANTLLRSTTAAIFPLFATYMFNALKVNYTGTLLGCVAVVLVPIPVVFWKYGSKIREKSKLAPTFPMRHPPADASSEEDGMESGLEKGPEEKTE